MFFQSLRLMCSDAFKASLSKWYQSKEDIPQVLIMVLEQLIITGQKVLP